MPDTQRLTISATEAPAHGLVTHARLMELLSYDPESGIFRWKRSLYNNRPLPGSIAGCLDLGMGYWVIKIDRKIYRAHRLAWFYMTGRWPTKIDHRSRNRADNRFSELREATSAQNCWNTSLARDSSSGLKGATKDDQAVRRKKWRARITVHGKRHELGRFETPQEAHAAYSEAAKKYFGDFANA